MATKKTQTHAQARFSQENEHRQRSTSPQTPSPQTTSSSNRQTQGNLVDSNFVSTPTLAPALSSRENHENNDFSLFQLSPFWRFIYLSYRFFTTPLKIFTFSQFGFLYRCPHSPTCSAYFAQQTSLYGWQGFCRGLNRLWHCR